MQWCFVKNGSISQGYDCAWVDYVQWTGLSPGHGPANWGTITYKYDPSGRRIKKTVDGYTTTWWNKPYSCTTTYLYDGDHLIAEYDGNNNLVRKYVYGPRIDEPVCMIDLSDSNAVYYYHFDGLGSVVALTDANGTCVQTYEYSVYGHVAASDPNHPNPFMFTGRQFDIETGLYYYRARYYNPYLGRFLQTDPVGYGMNLYAYCKNNPLAYTDPSGRSADPYDPCDPCDVVTVDGWTYYRYRVHCPEEAVYKLNALGYVHGVYHDLTKIMGTWQYNWDETRLITIGIGSVEGVKVYTLNGVGLLDEDTLNALIYDSVVRVNNWVRFPTPENLQNLQGKECDTPFYSMKIRTWLYYDRLDNSGDINYILEGHAMHHLRLSYTEGKVLVYAWKLWKYQCFPTEPVFFWFKKGYDEYSSRLWYSDLDEWLDDLLK